MQINKASAKARLDLTELVYTEETNEYFDSLLLKEFREIINSSNVFYS